MIECRLYGHAWDTVTLDFQRHHWVEGLQCMRCGTYREDEIRRRTGEVIRRRYKYPRNYALKEKKTRAELRVLNAHG